jgi:hypothetical protein
MPISECYLPKPHYHSLIVYILHILAMSWCPPISIISVSVHYGWLAALPLALVWWLCQWYHTNCWLVKFKFDCYRVDNQPKKHNILVDTTAKLRCLHSHLTLISETLDHNIPSSCIVSVLHSFNMVHVVKGRHYCTHTVTCYKCTSPQSLRWSMRLTLDLDSDNYQCFNHRNELESARTSRGMACCMHACMQRKACFIYPQDYVSQGNVWSSASRTCQRRLCAAYKVFAGYTCKVLYILTDFQVPERLHQGPDFWHTYLIDYIKISS